jgi:hypothetical protein
VDKFYNGKIEKWKGKKGKEKGYYKVNWLLSFSDFSKSLLISWCGWK